MVGKSTRCPVWGPGATLVSIQDVYALWRIGNKVGALKLWRDNNVSLVKPSKLRKLRDHLKLTDPTELKVLDEFIRSFVSWFGAENIISGAKQYNGKRRCRRSITVDGKTVMLLSHASWNPTSDDMRNGAYYLDKQLSYVGIR